MPSGGVALTDVGTAISDAINRKALMGSVEIRPPALDRIFDREMFGRKWKHVIEPRMAYTYVTGVENFAHILRFDDRDILSDSNAVEYAVVNRLYAKRTSSEPETCGPEGMPSLMVGVRHLRVASPGSTPNAPPRCPAHNSRRCARSSPGSWPRNTSWIPLSAARWSPADATFSPAPWT